MGQGFPDEEDDVAAVCSAADLDPADYKRFSGAMRLRVPPGKGSPGSSTAFSSPAKKGSQLPAKPIIEGVAGEASARTEFTAIRQLNSVLAGDRLSNSAVPPRPDPRTQPTAERPAVRNPSRLGLRKALERILPGGFAREGETRVLAVYPAAGGVGVTSLLAALGRIFSRKGERVLLLDGSPEPELSYFFGKDMEPDGVCWLVPSETSSRGEVRIVAAGAESASGAQERTPEARAWQKALEFEHEADWLLAEAHAELSPFQQHLLSAGCCLVLLVADVRSATGAGRLLRFFADREQAVGHAVTPHFLLNQFDGTVPFQMEIRELLRRELKDKLLPFEIPRCNEVSEALAEGMTVVDFAPNSATALSLLQLADRLESITVSSAVGLSHAERW